MSHASLQADPIVPSASSPDSDLLDDAATVLAGIAEALAYRTATDPDDLLEMLALAADAQARALRDE